MEVDYARGKEEKIPFCYGCLSTDRILSKPKDLYNLFSILLDSAYLEAECLVLCWECTAILQKIGQFQQQLQLVQRLLQELMWNEENKPFSSLSSLAITKLDSISLESTQHTLNNGLLSRTHSAVEIPIITSETEKVFNYPTTSGKEIDDSDVCNQESDVSDENTPDHQSNECNVDVKDKNETNGELEQSNDRSQNKIDRNSEQGHAKATNTSETGLAEYQQSYSESISTNTETPYEGSEFYNYNAKKTRNVCVVCCVRFHSMLSYRRHMTFTHILEDDSPGPFICLVCEAEFVEKDALRTHWESHEVKRATIPECVNCGSPFVPGSRDERYSIKNFGPKLLSVLQRDCEPEVLFELIEGGALCKNCFSQVAKDLPAQDINDKIEVHTEPVLVNPPRDLNVCVWCQMSLFNRTTCAIRGSIRIFVMAKIYPRQIPPGGLLCYVCWVHTRRVLQRQNISVAASPDPLHHERSGDNQCVWCRASLSQRRRHCLSDGPEKDEIAAKIQPRLIPEGSQVCYACWVAARRSVQRRKKGT